MSKLTTFAASIGFFGARPARTVNPNVLAFKFDTFNVETLWARLGQYDKHSGSDGRFVYILEKGRKIMRVDANKRVVLLGDGPRAYKAILKSVE